MLNKNNMSEKEITFKELTGVIRLTTFLEQHTNINPKGGIYPRINGKATNKTSKPKGLTIEDKKELLQGLKSLQNDINKVVKSFEKEIKNDKV